MTNIVKSILSLSVIVLLLLGTGLFIGGQTVAAVDEQRPEPPSPGLPGKLNPKLDSGLNRLIDAESRGEAESFSQQYNIELVAGSARVIVESVPDRVDTAVEIAGKSGIVETRYKNLIQVLIPVNQIEILAADPAIEFVRLPYYPVLPVLSEGVAVMNADSWQAAGYDGTGVKVAIIDQGFTGYSSLLGTELPASVTTHCCRAGYDIEGDTEHGTACAEVVYDIAPGAQFYLVTYGTDIEVCNAVDWAMGQNVDVICASLGSPRWGPGNGSGPVNEKFDEAYATGITTAAAMHNYAQGHWQGDFADIDSNGWHEFAPGDETNTIYAYRDYPILLELKWDDPWGFSSNDYDIYLYANDGKCLTWSNTYQKGINDPVEAAYYEAPYTGEYDIKVLESYSTRAVNFHLYCYYQELEYIVTAGSFTIPADSPSIISVGAVPWYDPAVLMSYSGRGPTEDGLVKPDIVAPTDTSTVSYVPSFGGTSCATPHAAGAAILVLSRYPSYTPSQVQSFLEGGAVDLGEAGKDNLYGSGRIDLGILSSPTIGTRPAALVTGSSAKLKGVLKNLGTASSVKVSFEWGTTTSYGNQTPLKTKSSTGGFGRNLSSLLPGTTYHYRAKGVGHGTAYGPDRTFTTLDPPVMGGRVPRMITEYSARLRGALKDLGTASSVAVSFEWGTTRAYGNETTSQARSTTGIFRFDLNGLLPGTTYHYRAKGLGDGVGYGPNRKFTTSGTPPTIGTRPAVSITSNSAKLKGALKDLGTASSVEVSFEWGLTTAYGNETPSKTKDSTGRYCRNLTGLLPGTTYHYRAKGVGHGISYGPDRTFTTAP